MKKRGLRTQQKNISLASHPILAMGEGLPAPLPPMKMGRDMIQKPQRLPLNLGTSDGTYHSPTFDIFSFHNTLFIVKYVIQPSELCNPEE